MSAAIMWSRTRKTIYLRGGDGRVHSAQHVEGESSSLTSTGLTLPDEVSGTKPNDLIMLHTRSRYVLRIGEEQRKSLFLNLGRFLKSSGNDTLHEIPVTVKKD